jgi:hypothetical protein
MELYVTHPMGSGSEHNENYNREAIALTELGWNYSQ